MNTRRPISTISYNSEVHLRKVLDYLLRHKIIEYWCYICHKGEFNETVGEYEKDHIHLFVIPNRTINTVDLGEYFIEEDDRIGAPPRKCIRWCTSVEDDWILYSMHDELYLASKFEVKQYHYTVGVFVTSDKEQFMRSYRHAFESSGYARARNIYSYFNAGGRLLDLMESGLVTPQTASHWQSYHELFKEMKKIEGTSKKKC